MKSENKIAIIFLIIGVVLGVISIVGETYRSYLCVMGGALVGVAIATFYKNRKK